MGDRSCIGLGESGMLKRKLSSGSSSSESWKSFSSSFCDFRGLCCHESGLDEKIGDFSLPNLGVEAAETGELDVIGLFEGEGVRRPC